MILGHYCKPPYQKLGLTGKEKGIRNGLGQVNSSVFHDNHKDVCHTSHILRKALKNWINLKKSELDSEISRVKVLQEKVEGMDMESVNLGKGRLEEHVSSFHIFKDYCGDVGLDLFFVAHEERTSTTLEVIWFQFSKKFLKDYENKDNFCQNCQNKREGTSQNQNESFIIINSTCQGELMPLPRILQLRYVFSEF